MELDAYIDTNKAADLLGVTVDRLRLLARRGEIPSVQVGKGPRLYDPQVIKEFQNPHKQKETQ